MKKYIAIFLLISLLSLSSCGPGKNNTANKNVQEIEKNVTLSFGSLPMTKLDDDGIEFLLDLDDDDYKEGFVFCNANGTGIDEVGIFFADEDNADSLFQKLLLYVNDCKTTKAEWLKSYNPAEAKKLENGTVFRFERCIGYAFLDQDLLNDIKDEIEK